MNTHRWLLAQAVVFGLAVPLLGGCTFKAAEDGGESPTASTSGSAPKLVHDIARPHDGLLMQSVAFSYDGKMLATTGETGHPKTPSEIKLWDATTGAPKAVLKGHSGTISATAFSQDGKLLASAAGDTTVRLWDVDSATEKTMPKGFGQDKNQWYYCLAFTPDGKTVIVDGSLHLMLWNVDTGKSSELKGFKGVIYAVELSGDGKTVASGCSDGTVKLWDVATGKLKTTLTEKEGDCRVAINHDGTMVASFRKNGEEINLLDVAAGTVKKSLKAPNVHSTACFVFSPDGKTLAGVVSSNVVLWNVETGDIKHTLQGGMVSGPLPHKHLAYSPDGKRLAAAVERSLKVWDLAP